MLDSDNKERVCKLEFYSGKFLLGKEVITQIVMSCWNRDGRFGSKVGQIGPKWDKSGAFFRSDFNAFGAGAPAVGDLA